MEFVLVNLNTLTRKQLQNYAKQNGVKANGKTIIMLEQLQEIQNVVTDCCSAIQYQKNILWNKFT